MAGKKKKPYVKTEVIFHPGDKKEMSIKKFLGNLPVGGKSRIIIKALLFYAMYGDTSEEKREYNVSFAPLRKYAKNHPLDVPRSRGNRLPINNEDEDDDIEFEETAAYKEVVIAEDTSYTDVNSSAKQETSSSPDESPTDKPSYKEQNEVSEKASAIKEEKDTSSVNKKQKQDTVIKGKSGAKKTKKPKTPSLEDFDDSEQAMDPSKEDMLDEMLNDLGNFN